MQKAKKPGNAGSRQPALFEWKLVVHHSVIDVVPVYYNNAQKMHGKQVVAVHCRKACLRVLTLQTIA